MAARDLLVRAVWAKRSVYRRAALTYARVSAPGCVLGAGVDISPGARVNGLSGGRVELGDGAWLGRGTLLQTFGGPIVVGARTAIGNYSLVMGQGGVTIGADCLISPHVVIVSADHHTEDTARPIREQGDDPAPVVIGEDVWIGAGAKVLRGVTIGPHSVVAAGAVVREDVAPYTVVGGVPARLLRERQAVADPTR